VHFQSGVTTARQALREARFGQEFCEFSFTKNVESGASKKQTGVLKDRVDLMRISFSRQMI
jgi:hypothetical protein